MKKPLVKVDVVDTSSKKTKNNSRRKFIKLGGLGIAGSTFLLYGCSEEEFNPGGEVGTPEPEPTPDPDPDPDAEVFDLGSGNLGILNYAYALEQLEAAFYAEVQNGGYYSGAPDNEKEILDDIWYHEVIHRDFFNAAINGAVEDSSLVLPELEFDFSSIDFDSREAVLGTALVLEDTGVSAYNGAGKLIDASAENGGLYLLLAGKIVSVEARHASAIADLLEPYTTAFARDEVLVDLGGSGLAYDKATPPADVLTAVVNTGFVATEFTANNLPTE